MSFKSKIIIGFVILVLVTFAGFFFYKNQNSDDNTLIGKNYNPKINPSDFTTKITNPYFSYPKGKKMIYKAETAEGFQKIVEENTGQTKKIQGVITIILRELLYQDGELAEESEDYLAQDNDGNVWHFGEAGSNYEDGEKRPQENLWTAGVNGGKAGFWMKAKHVVGDSYRQKYLKGEVEDIRDVVALNQTVTTARTTYHNCVKFYDWTPLDIKVREFKYYCLEVGGVVLTEDLESGAREELVQIISP